MRVLIVEDDAISAMYLKNQLQKLDISVADIVDYAEHAVEKADSSKYDLIIMDIRLKGEMDGIEAAGLINKDKYTPLIFLTGNSDMPTKQRALNTKHNAYLEKPVSFEDLREAVADIG